MEIILSGIAILLSLLSFYVSRNKVGTRALEQLRSRNFELQKKLDKLQCQVGNLQERPAPETQSSVQLEVTSSEMAMLKTEVGCIRRDLQTNSQKLLIHSQILESLKEEQLTSDADKATPFETLWQEPTPFGELDGSAQGSTPFSSLGPVAWTGAEQTTQVQPVDDLMPIEEPPTQPPEPYEQVARQYQDAIDRGDRQSLRQLQFKELNITSESEDSLLKGSGGQATKLEAVQGGGSFMVVSGEGRYWLFPTAQTLDSFSMYQPKKGIFDYEREFLSKPVVKKPAEVDGYGDDWIVIAQGVISVPG
ncbi:MAG: hypothetical protein QM522_02495 [Chitinophagaceae bacterium]|nr:hypothetical protein [Chitinophagaceae bacterium]